MIRDDHHWLALTDAFHSAALDGSGWYSALDGLAAATGSQSGELSDVGQDGAIAINLITNMDPAFHTEFVAAGGGDPELNPRVGAGWKAPILKVLAEADFITPDEYKRHPHYQEFARKWDVPYICLTTLARKGESLIGLAVVRNHSQGHINDEQRRAFASIAPHVRSAVRTHIAIDGQGDAVITGAMEALNMPAFVCDGAGVVRKLSPSAEALVCSGRSLQLRAGRLQAPLPADARALNDAIDAAITERGKVGAPGVRTVIVRGVEQDAQPLFLDVIALPDQQFAFNPTPRVLILSRGAAPRESRLIAVLQSAYGMTAAETEIALQLTKGKTPEAIAEGRNVAVGTVRAQIKALLAKAGATRQIELVAKLGEV